MESNGQPGRIHVSQAVADNLTAQGYSRWLEARKDKVWAKGKGEMQTYWIVGGATLSYGTGSAISNDMSEMDETTSRHQDYTTGDTTTNAEDDDFMLDLQEKLQQRAEQRKSMRISKTSPMKEIEDQVGQTEGEGGIRVAI